VSTSRPSPTSSDQLRVEIPSGNSCWWVPRRRPVDRSTSAVAYAYEQLRERILTGELAPGTPLSEYQLAKALSVSRTPVREALGRLQSVGLVRNIPQRGMSVRELGAEDAIEIIEIREQLECLAVRRIAEQGLPEETLSRWESNTVRGEELYEEGKLSESFALGCQLHDEIVSMAGNGRLSEMLGQLGEQIRLLGVVGIRVPGRQEAAARDHMRLVALLREGDVEGAVDAMRDHLRGEGEILLKALLPSAAFATSRSHVAGH
jgi:DNA-binding GntR family transcriptional regulator